LRRDIAREIRRIRPDRVLTMSGERSWDRVEWNHPDHLAVGERLRSELTENARAAGLPDGRLAELFAVFHTGRR